ncbi:MAG TPA: SCO family protein [Candidatus Binatia bacterium]|nr:SCO family protein [Candidatus Binatia bacterium]
MKSIKKTLLAVCMVAMPTAGFAKEPPPFAHVSISMDGAAPRRTVPDFSLIERSGKKVTLADLRGQVWIADFIYTKCTDTCPLQTADMARLQDRWLNEKELNLVSFSVDPEHDTPPVLSRYAARFKADPKRWLFVTGSRPQIVHLIEDGFHLGVASASSHANVILHSPRFVLVDKQGQIRGYYNNDDPKAMQRLNQDVASLLDK